ncbi:MAG: hypothetical protein JSU03_11105 [Bacteroidetes bacterium]|nr:hypothetical protein [Bacteroidota bacterium]MBS1757818.1 hypothetical protein [Bacteroidota bacterium]
MKSFPFLLQRNQMDCGPTCLYMVSKYYGRNFGIEKLRELSEIDKESVSLLGTFKTYGGAYTFLFKYYF